MAIGAQEQRTVRALVAAALLCVGGTGCSIVDSTPPAATTVPDAGGATTTAPERREDGAPSPAEKRVLRPARDVVRRPGGLMAADQATLVVEPTAGSALLAFDLPVDDRRCATTATLSLPVIESRVEAEVWVSLETELVDLPEGSDLGSSVVSRGSPSRLASVEDGRYTWNVTELLAWSVEHQSEPTLVFAVTPRFVGSHPEDVVLGASEGDAAATLQLVRDPAC